MHPFRRWHYWQTRWIASSPVTVGGGSISCRRLVVAVDPADFRFWLLLESAKTTKQVQPRQLKEAVRATAARGKNERNKSKETDDDASRASAVCSNPHFHTEINSIPQQVAPIGW